MILTVLEAQLPSGGAEALQAAYAAAGTGPLPPGLVRTELVRDVRDAARWRIQTWWASREALDAMRGTGTPAGVVMFRAAGAEPALSIFEVVDGLPRPTP
ncbi:Antibiotic biosynthesis monooxygenase (plasmid) [Gemmatirosa kalamazoonensis]|uniref:Antibiotic biosynthesis monooxygenase n=1 Tax=Gemmatirosa kalamazoonensis TaxID=861299 RepID=W0RQ24_9BACT|nr:antibiotic biosynthesis monooxygenase [Gemmatirosa kalamazoonensis]AHG92801.1 Antibiotic biosynthesis monooxygenase [Gemmatirosa kalamazoonensis]